MPLSKLDFKSIAKSIIAFLESCNLNLNRIVSHKDIMMGVIQCWTYKWRSKTK